MKSLFLANLLAAAALAAPNVIPLYPGAAPGSEGWNWKEFEEVGPKDTLRRVHNVTSPTLTVYLPPAASATGTGVVVCPGGGFRILAIDHEGNDVARWLNSIGVAAFVLKYRLARTGDDGEKNAQTMAERRKTVAPMAVADGLAAVKMVRARAAEWSLSPDRIGIMGFSAGGYVTVSSALQYDGASRPAFAAPIYPGVTEEIRIPADAPPLFLVHADDDRTVPTLKSSIRLYTEYKNAQHPVELHIYARGGHGFGMQKKQLPVDSWPDRLRDWMASQGLLKPLR